MSVPLKDWELKSSKSCSIKYLEVDVYYHLRFFLEIICQTTYVWPLWVAWIASQMVARFKGKRPKIDDEAEAISFL